MAIRRCLYGFVYQEHSTTRDNFIASLMINLRRQRREVLRFFHALRMPKSKKLPLEAKAKNVYMDKICPSSTRVTLLTQTSLKRGKVLFMKNVYGKFLMSFYFPPQGGVNVAAAVLIPLFLLLLIGVGVLVYFKRRTIRDRLSHYKFVRRST